MVAVPAVLLVVGAFTPACPAKDVIAVTTAFVLLIAAPSLTLAAVVLPFFLPRTFPNARRIIRAALFSFAALLLVSDFWAIGIFGGQKPGVWEVELIPAAILLLLAIAQVPSRWLVEDPVC
ncbi:MAG: hypothetical protein MUF48_07125 [Pirellulaceae bacterium]|jgi:hypothetical protein|nr:hypothetical protein [Pirellulaceae bacterium]